MVLSGSFKELPKIIIKSFSISLEDLDEKRSCPECSGFETSTHKAFKICSFR